MSTQTPPPGWYPDPATPTMLRWFDGTSWTPHAVPAGPLPARPGPKRWSGAKTAAVLSLGAVAFVVALGVMAAIAVPVFLNQQRNDAFAAAVETATCEQVVQEAVELSHRGLQDGQIGLASVVGAQVTKDERSTARPPTGGGATYLMTCQGIGTWDDGSTDIIRLSLSVDAAGRHVIADATATT
ncbi:DUF2510 domain-containing protein [Cellulomonas sp. DKR-3]|uniref:DUF2510 domain-containing protein n=1 Tax=Cellulomonas fulva TaxID=2835530 RepID=A0ABS5TXR4_9CELL|nr:DUF2510 domain-containing protein [Cellulomonas fulva]MBT0993891.1 DUF2510 domain-containing protein [Cellulomonas fulva]